MMNHQQSHGFVIWWCFLRVFQFRYSEFWWVYDVRGNLPAHCTHRSPRLLFSSFLPENAFERKRENESENGHYCHKMFVSSSLPSTLCCHKKIAIATFHPSIHISFPLLFSCWSLHSSAKRRHRDCIIAFDISRYKIYQSSHHVAPADSRFRPRHGPD